MESRAPHVFVSVVIPTYERNDLLARCLTCLAPGRQKGMRVVGGQCSGPGGSDENKDEIGKCESTGESSDLADVAYEVIVSDDGRLMTAEKMIRERFPWARWIAGPGRGPAGNRNSGVALARGEWIAFTDDDCLPEPGWLAAYHSAIGLHPGIQVFEGKTVPDRQRQTLAEHAPVGVQGGNLWSCNFMIRRGAFDALGGFDEQFRVCMEDNDFALRVRLSRMTFPFIESALVVHPWRDRKLFNDGWKSSEGELEDHLRFKTKHPNTGTITAWRTLRLGLRVFVCDVGFIVKKRDWRGIPYALMSVWQMAKISWQCARCVSRTGARVTTVEESDA